MEELRVDQRGILSRIGVSKHRHWIPPGGLLFAQACHGASWIAALWIAASGNAFALTLPVIGWIHLVALGWFTTAALSVLLFAIPQMAARPWRFERAARAALGWFAVGVASLTLALFASSPLIGAAATMTYAALLVYLFSAWATLAHRRETTRAERAIGRAFFVTLLVLAVVATLGLVLALALSGASIGAWAWRFPAAHGNLALFGWLSLLVYGVSTRTVRPITGGKPSTVTHIVVGTATLFGAFALAYGLAAESAAVTYGGAILLALGGVLYCVDILRVVVAAGVPHRPPQAFLAVSILWLLVALVSGGEALNGRATALAYGFAMLAGWIGQMVNAHMLHIGTRVLATFYRGADDETPPEALLDQRLEWVTFGSFQSALALIFVGLLVSKSELVLAGACAGFAGWCAMIVALGIARLRAMRPA